MTDQATERLSYKVIVAYAVPAAVFALPTIPVYIHLPALYGTDLGLGLATTGLILLLARGFDTLTDPLIGVLSDRVRLFGSARKPWILIGAVIAGFALVKVLSPPPYVAASYLLMWSALLYLGWTMVVIPYAAWGAELSANYHERARITSWREGLALVGIVLAAGAGVAAGSLFPDQFSDSEAVAAVAIIMGVVALPIMAKVVPERLPQVPTASTSEWMRQTAVGLKTLGRNKPFLRIFVAWFLNGIANGIPVALFFLYLEYGLGVAADNRSGFILIYFVAAVLAIPFWLFLSYGIGKHRTWCIAMGLACLAFFVVPFLPPGAFSAFAIICLITGASLGADLALPPAIQADVVDYDNLIHGSARTGLQFSLWGMCTKLALAIAVGTALPILEFSGFDPSTPSDDGIFALVVIYAVLPVIIKVLAIVLVWGFPLTACKQRTIKRRLEERDARRKRRGEGNEKADYVDRHLHTRSERM